MSWKKRGQKGWTGSKTAKETTKGRERQYGESEIKQQLQEDFEGDEFRYNIGKKSKNPIAREKYWLQYYQRRLLEQEIKEEQARKKGEKYCYWCDSSYYRSIIERHKKKIEELENCK